MAHWRDLPFDQLVPILSKVVFSGTLIALDPGETTGWCIFEDQHLVDCGQEDTSSIYLGSNWLDKLFNRIKPNFLVYELYRVYRWKTETHAESEIHTAQFIGVIQAKCIEYTIPFHKQSASEAKHLITDDKLELWGFYKKGKKHARDSIRHACYFQINSYKNIINNNNKNKLISN